MMYVKVRVTGGVIYNHIPREGYALADADGNIITDKNGWTFFKWQRSNVYEWVETRREVEYLEVIDE